MAKDSQAQSNEHVGVLVVHGIGPQNRFDAARALTRTLSGTLASAEPAPPFVVIDRTAQRPESELFCPSPDRNDSPFEIQVKNDGGGLAHIHIHEVWWADLGDPGSLADQLEFWLWGLGQWSARIEKMTHFRDQSSNTDKLMAAPKYPRQVSDLAPLLVILRARILLMLWGVAAFLTFFSWSALKQVLNWISSYVGSPALITQYVGDVRLYTQGPAVGGGHLIDIGQPWRATIRRRMVAELIAMAERNYHRWYLLGHSLGSVIAFNAVQETEWCLPNYLQPPQVERLRSNPLWTTRPYLPDDDPKYAPDLAKMMPRRPIWLAADEGVSREVLFGRYRGLLTYGAPRDKFATLWPRIVCLNKQRDVFRADADWVNLCDKTDPIGANLVAFSDPEFASPSARPTNYRVRASWLFLYSHLRYLAPHRRRPMCDSDTLLDVLLPRAPSPPRLSEAFGRLPGATDAQVGRHVLAYAQIVVLFCALALGSGLLAYMAEGLIGALIGSTPPAVIAVWKRCGEVAAALFGSGFSGSVAFVFALAFASVLAAGAYRRAREEMSERRRKRGSSRSAAAP